MNWWVLKRRIHVSWLIALTCTAIVVGVWLASVIHQGWFASTIWLVNGFALTALSWWRQWLVVVPFCLIGGLLIGLARGSVEQSQIAVYQQLVGQTVTIQGIVQQDVSERDDGQLAIRLKNVTYQDQALPGTVWLTAQKVAAVERSDHVTVNGKFAAGFGNFVGSMYRVRITSVERPEPGDIALHGRDWFASKVYKVVPDEPARLGLGYLLGMRRGLPKELEENLRIAGLTHVIVASGFHLSTVVRFGRRWFVRLSRFSAFAGSSFLMLSFLMVTGVSPSMARASLVTGLSLLAWYYGRKFHPLVIIPLAAAVTVLITPSYAWRDIGWLLSFAAFAGVMVLAPLLQRYFFGDKKPGNVRQILGETVSAQLTTLPILIVSFGYVSNLALIANLLVLPFVPLVMLLTLLAGLAVVVLPFLAPLIATAATWLLDYMIAVVSYIAEVSWAKTEIEVGAWFVIGYYTLLVAACFYMSRATRLELREANIVE